MKTRQFDLVEVQWVDAEAGASGWQEDDPEAEPQILRTFGLLIRHDKHFVVHASTFDPETKKYSERAKIPIGMVKEIRKIETISFEVEE